MKDVADWVKVWDERAAIEDPIELNGYCVGGQPLSAAEYRRGVIEPTLDRLELEPKLDLLEVGCGSGMFLKEFDRLSIRSVGVDPSKVMLARYQGPSRTYLAAAHEIEFEPESFDRILLFSAAHYFPSLEYFELVLKECLTLLRRPGIFVAGDLPNRPWKPNTDYLFFSERYLVDLLERLGMPHSIMAQNRIKRAVNQRLDVVIYKD